MKKPNIKLHIDELVLHGFAPGDRYAIADAVQYELSRLLAWEFSASTLSPSLVNGSEALRINAGNIQVTSGAKADSIGVQIAQAVHRGVTR